jgi:hypothetical protein
MLQRRVAAEDLGGKQWVRVRYWRAKIHSATLAVKKKRLPKTLGSRQADLHQRREEGITAPYQADDFRRTKRENLRSLRASKNSNNAPPALAIAETHVLH